MARNNRSSTGGRLYPPDRIYRYRVEYVSTDGETGVFGETDEADGGMPLAMAKLIPWVRSAAVVERQRAETLAVRLKELRDEAGLLRLLVVTERDPVIVGLMHDLSMELGREMALLRLEELSA